jgi:hypothetical protein
MLIRIAVAVCVVWSALTFWPATSNANDYYLGLRGGANLATLRGDEPASLDWVSHPVVGVVAVFRLTRWILFQPEVLYSSKGATGQVPVRFFGATGLSGSVELNYLEIPILLRVSPPLTGRIVPYVCGGPSVAANLSAYSDATFLVESGPVPMSFPERIDNVVTDGDLGLVLGGGVDFDAGWAVFEFDARYTHGLIAVDETRFSIDPRNRTWGFTLGLLFHAHE